MSFFKIKTRRRPPRRLTREELIQGRLQMKNCFFQKKCSKYKNIDSKCYVLFKVAWTLLALFLVLRQVSCGMWTVVLRSVFRFGWPRTASLGKTQIITPAAGPRACDWLLDEPGRSFRYLGLLQIFGLLGFWMPPGCFLGGSGCLIQSIPMHQSMH